MVHAALDCGSCSLPYRPKPPPANSQPTTGNLPCTISKLFSELPPPPRQLALPPPSTEAAALLSLHADKLTEDGRQRLVRHGIFTLSSRRFPFPSFAARPTELCSAPARHQREER